MAGTGKIYVSLSGKDLKEHEKRYKADYKRTMGEDGLIIDWKNAEVETLEVDNNELHCSLECAGVFVDVSFPLDFDLKIHIAKQLKEEVSALKELGMI